MTSGATAPGVPSRSGHGGQRLGTVDRSTARHHHGGGICLGHQPSGQVHIGPVHVTEDREDLTGRQVVAFLSQAHVEPDITMEIFFIDEPLKGFGALELIDPE